ncbi:hypothetical protein F5Y16DRAFT_156618 [Xylariaceae sp. FL0255]|nr:hypothetical protein F5Y16DRAFT_156618 [Xylariaceae sp. FL0255]
MSSSTAILFRQLPQALSPSYEAGYPHPRIPSWYLLKPQSVKETTLYSGGLRTPPAEDFTMSTAYHPPAVPAPSAYDNHGPFSRHPNAALAPARPATTAVANTVYDAGLNPYTTRPYPQHQPQQQLSSVQTLVPHSASGPLRHTTQRSTPTPTSSRSSHSEGTISRKTSLMVMHSLQLPDFISPNGGSLDEFAALMTCFFWFETMDTIQAAEQINSRRPSEPLPPLSRNTEPCPAYKKWVHAILTTTQVTQNVVFLALLFVYRLKKTNPRVHGNLGSEYRLLTVALMLGNKFLDDNTYTNKTWAEVSGLSVKEIHVMEVEFLSNMRYGLLTSKEQWKEWLDKLACYRQYCERAKADEQARRVHATPMHLSPNNHVRFASPVPSPTATLSLGPLGTPSSLTAAYSPVSGPQNGWNGAYHVQPSIAPLATKPSLGHGLVRKRSFEVGGESVEPPAKRASRQQPAMTMIPSMRATTNRTEGVRLPVPQLALDTSQTTIPSSYGSSEFLPSQSMVSLPPLVPGVRAMSTVYSTPITTWAPQGQVLVTCGPQTPSYTVPSNYGTPTKRHSPAGLTPFASSPLGEPYAHSPSVYLQQRLSPYKPVRRVSTLLNPPPSIPLSEYHLGSSQMHYQPLGRRHDLRSGILPEFLPTDGHARHYQ